MRTILHTAVLCLVAGSAFAQTAACPVPVQPIPSGVTARPNVDYSNHSTRLDSMWMHSSTNLQGHATKEKFAPCLFYNPTEKDIKAQLGGFQSALVINNPSPTLSTTVTVELRDRNGTLVPPLLNQTLGPNGSWTFAASQLQGAANGVGSARVTATNPIVGASLHYVDSVLIGGTAITDPDVLSPGEGTMQQLQAGQAVGTSLYAGPMPLSNSSNFDFLNGNLPFYCAMNTTPTPTNITAYKGTSGGLSFATITATLPGYGQFIDMSLWNGMEPIYLNGALPAYDDNAWAFVASDRGPLVGEVYLADFFAYGSPASPGMSLGKKFRVGSAMMANTPSYGVTSAEVTQETVVPLPRTDTMIGVLNASTVDIGPVTVTYRNRNGGVVGTNTVASLLPGQTLRLTPGTPGFPASPFFDGWADIRACKPGLIGWTMREITKNGNNHFEKAYGEELAGANGREPGAAIPVVEQGIAVNRKVAPIARVSDWWWPSYTNFANNSVANVGNYWYRFFRATPTTIDVTNYIGQPYAGVRYGNTSFTYQDGLNPQVSLFGSLNVSGRVDVTTGTVIGVTAIGDPLREWEIPGFGGNPQQPLMLRAKR